MLVIRSGNEKGHSRCCLPAMDDIEDDLSIKLR